MKARNHTLLRLSASFKTQVHIFLNKASNVGILHFTNTRSPKKVVYIELCIQNYKPHAVSSYMTS